MSVIASCEGQVRVATVTVEPDGSYTAGNFELVGESVSWEIDEKTEVKKRKILGRCTPKVSAGSKDWTISLKGYLDNTDTGQLLIQNGELRAVRVNPEGNIAQYYEGFGIFSGVKRDGDADGDYVNLDVTVEGDGELTKEGCV